MATGFRGRPADVMWMTSMLGYAILAIELSDLDTAGRLLTIIETPPAAPKADYPISVIWDSREHSEPFMRNALMPALPVPGGFAGLPKEHTADVTHHDPI